MLSEYSDRHARAISVRPALRGGQRPMRSAEPWPACMPRPMPATRRCMLSGLRPQALPAHHLRGRRDGRARVPDHDRPRRPDQGDDAVALRGDQAVDPLDHRCDSGRGALAAKRKKERKSRGLGVGWKLTTTRPFSRSHVHFIPTARLSVCNVDSAQGGRFSCPSSSLPSCFPPRPLLYLIAKLRGLVR